jgi:ribosomal protein L37E
MSCLDYEECWRNFELLKLHNIETQETKKLSDTFKCQSCGIIEYNELNVCTNCGLVKSENIEEYQNYTYDEDDHINNENTTSNINYKKQYTSSRLYKMNLWYSYSNDEKNTYKLIKYTKDLCNKLEITLYNDLICNTVNNVFDAIKKDDGTKRSRVKDGIIIVCIHYIYKMYDNNIPMNFSTILAKKIDLNHKYICKAEKTIIELINKNKISFNKQIYLNHDIKISQNYLLPDELYIKLDELIQLCQKKDIITEHTPYSIHVGCLYYIIKNNNINIDIYDFSKLYKLSTITILKIYNKLNSIL